MENLCEGDWVRYVQKEDWVTFVPVSNPVTQRLTVISEDASVSKKNYRFFSPGGLFVSINSTKTTFTINKKADHQRDPLFKIQYKLLIYKLV